jgi:hypothetical protein
MSRTIIHDVVIPIVQKIMAQEGIGGPWSTVVQDPNLEEFLEEAMRMYFGVIGANDCQHLREQLEQAMKNDPYAFEFLVKRLLEKYTKLAVRIRSVQKTSTVEQGPPDRFSEQRRNYRLLFSRQEDQQIC